MNLHGKLVGLGIIRLRSNSHPTSQPASSHTSAARPIIEGTIPDCIGSNLTSLVYLELATNDLHGPIPDSLCLIGDTLIYLILQENGLSGEYVRLVVCGGCGGRRGVCARSWLGLAHAAHATAALGAKVYGCEAQS